MRVVLQARQRLPERLQRLQKELATYKAACIELPEDNDVLRWWRLKMKDLPSWALLLRKVLLLSPSSAAVERVFSILRRTFGQQQDVALADYMRTSLFLQGWSRF